MAKPFKAALLLSALGYGFWNKARHPQPAPEAANDTSGKISAAAGPSHPHARSSGDAAPGAEREGGRGRAADKPSDIPKKGWKDVLIRTWKEFGDDQIPMISAGITFYCLLALFPAIGAFAGLYGLFADTHDAQKHLAALSVILPGGAIQLIGDQLTKIAAAPSSGLSLAFVFGLLTSIWSANGAVKAMITGLNIAYDEKETRKFVRKTLTSLAFTLGFLVFVIMGVAVMAARPAIDTFAGKGAGLVFSVVTWPVLLILMGLGLALLYRFGPSRDRVKWRWISWGSIGALVVWVIMSAGFSIYVANFGHYDKTYGSLGAAIGFMTWTWLSSMVVLLGAELNAEIEHQTAKDTTVGPEQALGQRGANMADTVGEAQGR